MEGNMKKPLYFDYIKISSIAQLSHKEAFFTELLIWSLYSLTPFLSLLLLLQKYATIAGMNIYQIAVLYGVTIFSYDLARMFGRGFDNFSSCLYDGSLDVFYVRPLPIIYQIFSSEIFFRRLAGVSQGFLISTWGMFHLHAITPFNIIKIFIVAFSTVMLYCGLFILNASLSLFTSRENIFVGFFIDITSQMGYYPLEKINILLKIILVYIFPVGTCVYFPISDIVSHPQNTFSTFISFIIGGFFLFISLVVFDKSRKCYVSVNN